MVPDAWELHVDWSNFNFFINILANMFQSLSISVSNGIAVIDQKQFTILLPWSNHEMFGVDVVMYKVFEVVIL